MVRTHKYSSLRNVSWTDMRPSPGRFFAVNEVKAMMAHIILNYDIKLPGDSREAPKGVWFAGSRSPHTSAEILFKKRKLD